MVVNVIIAAYGVKIHFLLINVVIIVNLLDRMQVKSLVLVEKVIVLL